MSAEIECPNIFEIAREEDFAETDSACGYSLVNLCSDGGHDLFCSDRDVGAAWSLSPPLPLGRRGDLNQVSSRHAHP